MLALSMNACATSSAGIATSNVPLEGIPYEIIGPAETTLTWWTFDIALLGIPLNVPPVDRAQEELLAQKNGQALVNIRYWTDRSIYLFMTRNRLYMKADVVRIIPEKKKK